MKDFLGKFRLEELEPISPKTEDIIYRSKKVSGCVGYLAARPWRFMDDYDVYRIGDECVVAHPSFQEYIETSNPAHHSTNKEEAMLVGILPAVGIGTALVVAFAILVQKFALSRRVHYQDGQCLVSVRYPGQWHDIRSFVQPENPDVLAIFSQFGPDYWSLYDFVCRNIDYRRDVSEFWQTPSETLQGYGDCEDTSLLLCSLLRNFSDAHVALGSFQGWWHAWVVNEEGEILEATYTTARPAPDPEDYVAFVLFSEREVIELWPGALGEVFELGRDEATKLNLMAEAVECMSL